VSSASRPCDQHSAAATGHAFSCRSSCILLTAHDTYYSACRLSLMAQSYRQRRHPRPTAAFEIDT
jgi:hypothetical protein